MYFYLDESGDLGVNFEDKKSSKKFVITILVCLTKEARQGFRCSIQRTIKNKINKKKKKQNFQELKGTKTELNIKKYFLRNVKREDWKIFSLVLDKTRVEKLMNTPRSKKKMYNFLARVLLEEISSLVSQEKEKIELVIDKSKSSEEIDNFDRYVENHLEALLPLNVPLNIYHVSSNESYELQAVDLFCWGIYRKHEHLDLSWYECYSNKIECEREFPE